MKWNWGTKLVIAMAAFMIMVIAMVIYMMRQDVSLVEPDYYPRGQAYEELIQKARNTIPFAEDIQAKVENGTVMVVFPPFFEPEATKGEVHFYHRMSDSGDHHVDLVLDNSGLFSYPSSELKGRYVLKIDWEQHGIGYYTEKNIVIK